MKVKIIFLCFFAALGFNMMAQNTTCEEKETSLSKTMTGSNDTIVFDISNAITTVFSSDSSYIDIPLYITSDEIIYNFNFQFQFNQSKLTYNSINDYIPNYLSSVHNYRSQTDLYLAYSGYIANTNSFIQLDTTLTVLRFKFKTKCDFQLDASDFYHCGTILNGNQASYKITTFAPDNVQAQFSTNNLCSNSIVTFNNTSTSIGPNTTWQWNFGNGNTSTLQNPTTTYTLAGTYTTSLIVVTNNGCSDTIQKQLVINASPLSGFSYTLDCLKDSVYFTNTSTIASGTISSWSWNFGDLGTSNIQNPSHHYNSGGTYTVSITSTSNLFCSNTTTTSIVLNKPIANFITSSLNNCIGSTLNFSNTSTYSSGTITSWNWDFGDGNNSTQQHTNHSYAASGTYTVTLTSTSNSGCSGTTSQTVVINDNPTVQFGANNLTGCSTQTVNFSDLSTTATGSTYFWNFGDNTNSTQQNPTHVYLSVGTYSVKLTVISPGGCSDSLTKLSYIHINESPASSFSVTNGCVNSNINFINNSTIPTGTITSTTWNFGDGNNSNQYNPTHMYSASGIYTVTLTNTSSLGCTGTISQTIAINNKPIVQFSANNLSGCATQTVNFSDLSSTTAGSTYQWNFGDNTTSTSQNPTHIYISAGTFTVKLIVNALGGCSDSLIKASYVTIYSEPAVNFSFSNGCVNSNINFTNNTTIPTGTVTSYAWNFGDGNLSTTQTPTHAYNNSGSYIVTLTGTSNNGCSSSSSKTLTISNKPVVQFNTNADSGCVPLNITLTDLSSTVGSVYNWSFGDNSMSTLQNPAHTYNTSGVFTVKLIVTAPGGCKDSLTKTNYITALNPPTALFSVATATVNLPNAVASFTNLSTNSTNYIWNFGDTQSSTIASPTHMYSSPDTYQVCLTAYNTSVCTDQFCSDVIVISANTVAIPLAFTPNGDNNNDVLKVRGGPFIEFNFCIYNEWGNMLFSSKSQDEGWHGTFKGEQQPVGPYEFTFKGITAENKVINLYGIVNLIR